MYPTILGYPSVFVFWGIGIAVGFIGAALIARKDGFPVRTSLGLTFLIAFFFLLGTKIHAWWVSPEPFGTGGWVRTIQYGFHFPGGLILMIIISPLLFRLFRVPALRFLDSIIPVVGISIAVARVGCLLSGCCFGVSCDLPWGVSYPAGSSAYRYLAIHDGLLPDRLGTIPLHPLAAYFILAGLGIAAVLFWMRKRKHFDGQLVLWFVVMWGWSKAAIESLRYTAVLPLKPHLLEAGLVVALASTLVLAGVTYFRTRRTAQGSELHKLRE